MNARPMLTFLWLCQQTVLPWRFRVRLALDLASTLSMLHAGQESRQQLPLDLSCVKIDTVHWRAYLSPARGCAELQQQQEEQQEQEHIFQLGLMICALITGGVNPASFLKSSSSNATKCLQESALESKVLGGCPAMLEALTLLCCSAVPSVRPTAHRAAEELSQLLSELCAPLVLDATGKAFAKRVGVTDDYSYLYSPQTYDPAQVGTALTPTPDSSLPPEVCIEVQDHIDGNWIHIRGSSAG